MAQITAEELGVRLEDIRVISGDTELAPIDLGNFLSGGAFVTGNAVRLAAASRPHQTGTPDFINDWVSWGAGTRAAQYLVLGAKARALLKGRAHVPAEDIHLGHAGHAQQARAECPVGESAQVAGRHFSVLAMQSDEQNLAHLTCVNPLEQFVAIHRMSALQTRRDLEVLLLRRLARAQELIEKSLRTVATNYQIEGNKLTGEAQKRVRAPKRAASTGGAPPA